MFTFSVYDSKEFYKILKSTDTFKDLVYVCYIRSMFGDRLPKCLDVVNKKELGIKLQKCRKKLRNIRQPEDKYSSQWKTIIETNDSILFYEGLINLIDSKQIPDNFIVSKGMYLEVTEE